MTPASLDLGAILSTTNCLIPLLATSLPFSPQPRCASRGEIDDEYRETRQLTFFAACLSLNAEKIERTQAVVTRKLTPGQWTYSIDILEQESLVKQLKQHFHQAHEPSHGREVTWAIKLLLNWVR